MLCLTYTEDTSQCYEEWKTKYISIRRGEIIYYFFENNGIINLEPRESTDKLLDLLRAQQGCQTQDDVIKVNGISLL